ncbi:MAG: capsular polysaccharide export protein, LipB/KpsS family, partial [Pseudobdellovibrionaceae bacterium]
STAVVTINSKVGAEALSRGMPVLTFGNAFYTNRGLTPHFANWEQVAQWFQQALFAKNPVSPRWLQFLENVWRNSFATELYDLTPSNVQEFSLCIKTVIRSK